MLWHFSKVYFQSLHSGQPGWVHKHHWLIPFTKAITTLQTTIWRAFSWMISQCWLNFASPLYSRVLLITCHHWFKWQFGCKQAQSHYLFHLWCSSLIHVSIVKLRGVNMRRHVTLPPKCGLCTCCHLLALNIHLNNGWWISHDGAEMVKDIIKIIF